MLYYDLNNTKVLNDADLIDEGHGGEDFETLAKAEIFPLTIEKPDYDTVNEGIEPDGTPMPDNDTPGWWIQRMRVYSLVERFKTSMKEQATERRWVYETGGITLQDGTRIATKTEDQNRVANALQTVADAGITEVNFKAESGWVHISVEELKGIAVLIANHVQACFNRECDLHKAIDAATTVEELQTIDVNTGWPGAEPSEA